MRNFRKIKKKTFCFDKIFQWRQHLLDKKGKIRSEFQKVVTIYPKITLVVDGLLEMIWYVGSTEKDL